MVSNPFKRKIIKGGKTLGAPSEGGSEGPKTKQSTAINWRNVKIVAIALAVVVVVGLVLWWLRPEDTIDSDLTHEQELEYLALQEDMRKSEVKDGLDASVYVEISSSLRNKKYADAKKQTENYLQTQNLLEKDKRALLTLLAQACLPLKDFGCIDRVVAEYGSLLDYDFHYLVEAARAAKDDGNQQKAKEYYQKAFTEIEKLGGEKFVTQANEQTQITLDYEEIKAGAQQ